MENYGGKLGMQNELDSHPASYIVNSILDSILHHTSYIIHHTLYIIHYTSYMLHHTLYIPKKQTP